MGENRNPEVSIQGQIVPFAIVNAKLSPSSVMGSVDLGRSIIPKYADLILRYDFVTDFPPVGDERLIYLSMSTMTMYLRYDETESYTSISNSIDAIYIDTTENWNSKISFIPERKDIIIYSDHGHIDDGQGNVIDIPAIKIGDGNAYLIDLPFVGDDYRYQILSELRRHTENTSIHVSQNDRDFWDNKLNCEVLDGNLIFNRL